jgi:hypothetical protein
MSTGVFFGVSPVTSDPMVAGVSNLYRRTNLLKAGAGTYELVTSCSLCEASNTPLTFPADQLSRSFARPFLGGASPDLGLVAFESRLNLTADAPAQPAFCDPTQRFPSLGCGERLYEWDHGTVRLAGRIPAPPASECDDAAGPACVAADASFAGEGAKNFELTPDVVSDGSDGHSRIFFTQPTDTSGKTLSQQGSLFEAFGLAFATHGNLFVRVDHAVTAQLNASERTDCADHSPCSGTPEPDAFAPAAFLDASKDGTRAFFMTSQALTDDAPADGRQKIYMYDATKPGSDPHNLTLVDADSEPADGTNDAIAEMGVSDDGRYFYFMQNGALVRGDPLGASIYLWHDGQLTRVGPAPPLSAQTEDYATGFSWGLRPPQVRVSPDGRVLLFSTTSGAGLTGYDHGSCDTGIGTGCRELYVYSTDTGEVACASCNPSGAPAVGMATEFLGDNTIGGTRTDPPHSSPLTADGSKVFFSSPDALVSADTNGRYDVYEYDVRTGALALLTSGTDNADSYFINASPSGNDVFVATRQRLVGWDTDENYDMYDVRARGGFAEPSPQPGPCSAGSCQTAHAGAPALLAPGSASFGGAGNFAAAAAKHGGTARCKRGYVRRRVRGRVRCVRRVARRARVVVGRHS